MISNPTFGTSEITPERRLKIEKALRRAARGIAFRFYLSYLRFQIVHFVLKYRKLALEKACDVVRFRLQFLYWRHCSPPAVWCRRVYRRLVGES